MAAVVETYQTKLEALAEHMSAANDMLVELRRLADKHELVGCSSTELPIPPTRDAREQAKPITNENKTTTGHAAKTTKEDKRVPLPFDPKRVVTVEQGGCQGLRTNHGLYTQCTNKPAPNPAEPGQTHNYCKVCLKQMDKNSHGRPNAGTVADRLAIGTSDVGRMAYFSPDGKRVLPYGKVCQLLSIDQDFAVAQAYKAGVTIPDGQWVVKQRKSKKGKKPSKTAAVTDSSSESETDESAAPDTKQKKTRKTKKTDTEQDLIAELVRQTSATEVPALLVEVGEELNEMCAATTDPTPASVPAPSSPTSSKKGKKEKKKKKDPNAPKRAPSAYNLFIQDKENRAKYAEASAKEIMSKLSADWKALNETDKKVWTEKAAARKAQLTTTTSIPEPVPVPVVEELEQEEKEVQEDPLPTPAPVVKKETLPARIIEGFEHVKKGFPELELDEYLNVCVTDGEETEDEGDVVIETLIYKGVTYYKDSEGLVYDGDDTQVGVWDPATEDVEFLYG